MTCSSFENCPRAGASARERKSVSLWRKAVTGLASCSVAALLVGCGDDSEVLCSAESNSPECTQTPGAESSGSASPAYVVGSRVFDDTSTMSYFHVTSGLDAGVAVDPTRALEVPGSATLYSAFDIGWFAVGSGEEPTITRYELDAAGAWVAGQSMSFFAQGVADLWDTLYFVSPTKAYYPDRDGGQIIVWNPSTMEVTATVPLPQTLRTGYLALYGYQPIWRGSELLISVGWFDWDVTDSVLPETGLLVFDTATDSVVRFDTDTRCGGVTTPVNLSTGDAYLVSSALAGAAHRVGRLATAPCALRIAAGSNQIDAEYSLPLETITGSSLAGEPIPANDGVFLRAFDESLATVEGPMATWEFTGQSAWRWLRWDPATNETLPMLDIAPSTADVTWFQVDGRVYGSETTPDYSETTLIELAAEAGPTRSITVPGFVHGVTRVR